MDDDRLMRVPEIVKMFSIARSTWWGWVKSGKAPAPIKIGGVTCWRRRDLIEMVERAAAPRESK